MFEFERTSWLWWLSCSMSDTTAHDEIKIESRDESNLAEQVEILGVLSAESPKILSYLLPSLLLARSTQNISRQLPVNRPFLHPLNFNAGGPHGPIVLSRSFIQGASTFLFLNSRFSFSLLQDRKNEQRRTRIWRTWWRYGCLF